MKRLTCEMCGSTDLVKDGGVFVCQSCGCKYSIEEARKMMVEGTVDIRGTVQVDNSAFVQKYLENARRAKEKEDWEETEKYYNMVEQNDPNNIEAIFYSAYGKAKATLVDSDIYKRQATFKVLMNCISIIDDKYQLERREENKVAINGMAEDLAKMICSDFVFTEWKNGYGQVTKTNKAKTYVLFGELLDAYYNTIQNIKKIDDQVYMHEASIRLFQVAILAFPEEAKTAKETLREWIDEEIEALEVLKKKKIAEYWSNHSEEKNRLDSEKASLNAQIAALNESIAVLAEVISVNQIEKKIESLKQERKSLGIFKGKEKKALQEQIDNLNSRLATANIAKDNAVAPIQKEIDKLEIRIIEIDEELTKER